MRCEQFEDRLNELMDQRANPLHDQRLAHHAERCPDCRSLLETQRLVLSILQRRRLDRQAGPRGMTTPSAGHRQRHWAGQQRPQQTAWLPLLTAACLATVLLSSWVSGPASRPEQEAHRRVASGPPPQNSGSSPTTVAASRPLAQRPALQEPASTPNEMSPPWAEWRELDLAWLLPEAEVPRLSRAQLLDRFRQLVGTIRTLTSSVGSTLNIIKRSWPGAQTQAKISADQAANTAESDRLD